MKFVNKLFNFGYTLAIVICLIKLASLETGNLEKITEIILALVAVIKAININSLEDEQETQNNEDDI